MTIVMGLDQHRAQITAEWLDTDTGEVSRRRVTPADRPGVRAFAARFRGQQLEVALEATTGLDGGDRRYLDALVRVILDEDGVDVVTANAEVVAPVEVDDVVQVTENRLPML